MRQNLCSPACEIFDLQPNFCHLIRTIHPSICPHPSEYRLLAFSAASVSGPQWKENSLCRCVPHPQPLTNGSIKAAILLSVRRLCSGCISRHQARPSSLLYKINKLIIVFWLVCLHCLIYFVWKQWLLPTAGLQWEFICSLLLVTERRTPPIWHCSKGWNPSRQFKSFKLAAAEQEVLFYSFSAFSWLTFLTSALANADSRNYLRKFIRLSSE